MTGIPNRFGFETHLRRRSEAAASSASAAITGQAWLGLIDLDDLRRVASTFGYSAADEVLAEFSRRLSGLLGDGDYLAFLGGETFAVVLDNLGDGASPEVTARLARLHEAVERPFPVSGESVSLGITMGIARLPAAGAEAGAHLLAYRAFRMAKPASDNAESWWRLVSDTGRESAGVTEAVTVDAPRVPAGRDGLVSKQANPDDARSCIPTLTKTAASQVAAFEQALAKSVAAQFASLTDTELARLAELLGRTRRTL